MKRTNKEDLLAQRLRKSQDVARRAIGSMESSLMLFTSLAKREPDTIVKSILEGTRDSLAKFLPEYRAIMETIENPPEELEERKAKQRIYSHHVEGWIAELSARVTIEGDELGTRFLGYDHEDPRQFCVFPNADSARIEARRVLKSMAQLSGYEIQEYRKGQWYSVGAGLQPIASGVPDHLCYHKYAFAPKDPVCLI